MKGVMRLFLLKRLMLLLISIFSSVMILDKLPHLSNADDKIYLPLKIENTDIILESIQMNHYTGSMEAVFCNESGYILESFYIEIYTACDIYHFESTMLPDKGRILLQDRDHKYWDHSEVISCTGLFKQGEKSDNVCSLRVDGEYLYVNNTHNKEVSFDIYLKPWDEEHQYFLSENTKKIIIHDLQNNDTLVIKLPYMNYKIVYRKEVDK